MVINKKECFVIYYLLEFIDYFKKKKFIREEFLQEEHRQRDVYNKESLFVMVVC